VLVKQEENRLVGGPRGKCRNNIKMDHREIEWGSTEWIHLAQDRDQQKALLTRKW
jgi:hypothetical protein